MFRSPFIIIFAAAALFLGSAEGTSVFDFKLKDIEGHEFDPKPPQGDFDRQRCLVLRIHWLSLPRSCWPRQGVSFRQKPLQILAFPCNQFGEQEPGTNEEISEFAELKGATFHVMEKIDVNGPNASELYKFLKEQAGIENIEWNFATYFLVGRDGSVQAFSGVEPKDLRPILYKMTGRHPPNPEL